MSSVQCSPAIFTPVRTKAELKRRLSENVRSVEFLASTGGYLFADDVQSLIVVGPTSADRRWYATVTNTPAGVKIS